MPIYADFVDGPFADNVLRYLRRCPIQELVRLNDERKLLFYAPTILPYQISHKTIDLSYLSDYSEAAGVPVSYLIFGKQSVPTPSHTPNDVELLWYLSRLPEKALLQIQERLHRLYPNAVYFGGLELSQTRRMFRVIKEYCPRNIPQLAAELTEEGTEESLALAAELKRYIAAKYTAVFTLNSELWVPFSRRLGISLHWLLGLRLPLYGSCDLVDQIYDYYTLLPRKRQPEVFYVITGMTPKMEVFDDGIARFRQ